MLPSTALGCRLAPKIEVNTLVLDVQAAQDKDTTDRNFLGTLHLKAPEVRYRQNQDSDISKNVWRQGYRKFRRQHGRAI